MKQTLMLLLMICALQTSAQKYAGKPLQTVKAKDTIVHQEKEYWNGITFDRIPTVNDTDFVYFTPRKKVPDSILPRYVMIFIDDENDKVTKPVYSFKELKDILNREDYYGIKKGNLLAVYDLQNAKLVDVYYKEYNEIRPEKIVPDTLYKKVINHKYYELAK